MVVEVVGRSDRDPRGCRSSESVECEDLHENRSDLPDRSYGKSDKDLRDSRTYDGSIGTKRSVFGNCLEDDDD